MKMKDFDEDPVPLFQALRAAREAPSRCLQEGPGAALRRLRRGLNVSQAALAERSGVARTLIARIESGADTRIATLSRLYAALGARLVFLPSGDGLLAAFRTLARARRMREVISANYFRGRAR